MSNEDFNADIARLRNLGKVVVTQYPNAKIEIAPPFDEPVLVVVIGHYTDSDAIAQLAKLCAEHKTASMFSAAYSAGMLTMHAKAVKENVPNFLLAGEE